MTQWIFKVGIFFLDVLGWLWMFPRLLEGFGVIAKPSLTWILLALLGGGLVAAVHGLLSYQLKSFFKPFQPFNGLKIFLLFLCLCTFSFFSFAAWDQALTPFEDHPIWKKTETLQLEASIPEPLYSGMDWEVLPFFYTLGSWPKKGAFYSLVYQKGPPTHFIHKIQIEFPELSSQMAIEGPQTPEPLGKELPRPRMLEQAFQRLSGYQLRAWLLERPVKRLKEQDFDLISHQWVQVQNPMIPDSEQVQGLLLRFKKNQVEKNEILSRQQTFSSTHPIKKDPQKIVSEIFQDFQIHPEVDSGWIHERVILINAKGMHQTLSLTRPDDEKGARASQIFFKILASMRLFDEISSGRAWIEESLSHLQIPKNLEGKDLGNVMNTLASAQNFLLAHLSVNPQSLSSYYHLAGTSFLLLRQLVEVSQKQQKVYHTPKSFQMLQSKQLFAEDEKFQFNLFQISQAAKLNLKSAAQYAQDIAQRDPSTQEILKLVEKAFHSPLEGMIEKN